MMPLKQKKQSNRFNTLSNKIISNSLAKFSLNTVIKQSITTENEKKNYVHYVPFQTSSRFSGKESASQCRRLVPGLERSPGEGNGNPL